MDAALCLCGTCNSLGSSSVILAMCVMPNVVFCTKRAQHHIGECLRLCIPLPPKLLLFLAPLPAHFSPSTPFSPTDLFVCFVFFLRRICFFPLSPTLSTRYENEPAALKYDQLARNVLLDG